MLLFRKRKGLMINCTTQSADCCGFSRVGEIHPVVGGVVISVKSILSAVFLPSCLFPFFFHFPLPSSFSPALTVSPNGNDRQQRGKAPECEWVTSKIDPVFPSHLMHGVPQNQSDDARISLSFNTWGKGSVGDKVSLTYLPLDRCL